MISKTKSILLLCTLSICAYVSNAQKDSTTHPRSHFFEFYLMYGIQVMDYSRINPELQKTGIDKLSTTMVAVGPGVSFNVHRMKAGLEAAYLVGQDINGVTNSGNTVRLYLGYDIIRTKRCTITPELGITWQSINVNITRLSQADNFYDALLHQLNKVQVENNNTMLDPAITFKFGPLRSFAGNIGAGIALKVGYHYGLHNKAWQVSGSDVSDGPHDRLSSPYVTLMVRFGRAAKR